MVATGSTTAAGRNEYLDGARAMLPWLVGLVPYGLVIGVTVAGSRVPGLAGWATGPLIYGASAQLSTIALLDRGAAPLVIVATALVVQARLLLYGSAMAGHWAGQPGRWRALAAYLLVDPSFAVGTAGYTDRGPESHRYYLGAAVTLWAVWQVAIAIGLTVGGQVPSALRLELVAPLYLLAQAVPRVADRPALMAAATAGAVAVLASPLPFHTGLPVAIAAGLAAGLSAERAR